MELDFLISQHSRDLLLTLRKTGKIDESLLQPCSTDDLAYFQAELAIRKAAYLGLESRIPIGTSEWVKKFCLCYRDLFTNPSQALTTLEQIFADCPQTLDLPSRLNFWRVHLLFMTGQIEKANYEMQSLQKSIHENYFWSAEAYAITALGQYFYGETKKSLKSHRVCQEKLDQNPDIFIQTFNAAMATRAALKICDANSFEFFSQKLEIALAKENDSRYRLRHIGYRALILNQLGEHDAAEKHWHIGDQVIHETESALERGQYLLYRGLSYSLQGNYALASSSFKSSHLDLHNAGSPPAYIAELEIVQKLSKISNPNLRGQSIKKSFEIASSAEVEFTTLLEKAPSEIKHFYAEACQFCVELLSGQLPSSRNREFSSIILSILDNVSRSKQFVNGISHFRLIPNFIEAVKQTGISSDGISTAIQQVLHTYPTVINDQFHLPIEREETHLSPEVKTILDFATTLRELGGKADRLFTVEARLKETQRATHLLHDLRFFAGELSRLADETYSPTGLSKLAIRFTETIDNYLTSLRTGTTLETPSIVPVSKLLQKISSTAEQITGKKVSLTGELKGFLWVSEPLIQRTLLNLIKNGIEAGSGDCPVNVEVLEINSRTVFRISDNGTGISEHVLNSMFDNSNQTTITTKSNGSGLGLRSAVECASLINTEIEVMTSNSNGTVFEVRLPQTLKSFDETFKPHILVIDDSEAVRESWNVFSEISHLPVLAIPPETAIHFLNNLPNSIRWVILDYDLKLPHCTGADLAEPIQNLGVKIALSSGFQSSELPDDVQRITWDAILTKKPQDPDLATKYVVQNIGLRTALRDQQSRAIRHDIRNEITPLKTVLGHLQNQATLQDVKSKKYLELFRKSVDALDELVERSC
jgi:signal transduction histidine kinase